MLPSPDYPGSTGKTDRSKMTIWKNCLLPFIILGAVIVLIIFLSIQFGWN
ncbi:MAG: hypothetical protein RIC03_01725 [Cyclobacteriaceae bacterium]